MVMRRCDENDVTGLEKLETTTTVLNEMVACDSDENCEMTTTTTTPNRNNSADEDDVRQVRNTDNTSIDSFTSSSSRKVSSAASSKRRRLPDGTTTKSTTTRKDDCWNKNVALEDGEENEDEDVTNSTLAQTNNSTSISISTKAVSNSLFGAVMSRSAIGALTPPASRSTRTTSARSSTRDIPMENAAKRRRSFIQDLSLEGCDNESYYCSSLSPTKNSTDCNRDGSDRYSSTTSLPRSPSTTATTDAIERVRKQYCITTTTSSGTPTCSNTSAPNSHWSTSLFPSPTNTTTLRKFSTSANPRYRPTTTTASSPFHRSQMSPAGQALLRILEQAKTTDAFSTEDWEDTDDVYNTTTTTNHDESSLATANNSNIHNNNNNTTNSSTDDWYYSKLDWNHLVVSSLPSDNVQNHPQCIIGSPNASSKNWPTTIVAPDATGILFLDKSIKRRVRIECHPGKICTPGTIPPELLHQQPTMEQRAMSLFLLMSTPLIHTQDQDYDSIVQQQKQILSSLSILEQAIVRWTCATMYWQHPAIHPLPREMLLSNYERNKRYSPTRTTNKSSYTAVLPTATMSYEGSHTKSSPISFIKSLLHKSASVFKHVRSVAGIGSLGGLGYSAGAATTFHSEVGHETRKKTHKATTSSTRNVCTGPTFSNMIYNRHKEWQESFRSMYILWVERIDQWNDLIGRTRHQNRTKSLALPLPMFYALNLGQTILFTCARPPASSAESKKGLYFVPQIILSSSTRSLRDYLRHNYDIQLYVREGFLFEEEEDSNVKNNKESNGTHSNRNDDDNEHIRELRALRNAAHAGADVMIISPPPVRKRKTREESKCAIIIYGVKDCHSFYEMYLNRIGNLLRLPNSEYCGAAKLFRHNDVDVPLLLNRSLGPCLHSCLSRLTVASRKVHHKWMDDVMMKNDEALTNNHSSFELRGPILPCSVRELLASTILTLYADYSLTLQDNSQPEHCNKMCSPLLDEVTDVGSHYFVAHLQTHEGENLVPTPESRVSGDPSSFWFNGHHHGSCEEHYGMDECNMGQVISVVVWDSARPESLAYNVDCLPSS
jgi:hypothetical protein